MTSLLEDVSVSVLRRRLWSVFGDGLRGRREEERRGVGIGDGGGEKGRVVLWRDLPEWQQRGSEHIQTGYRQACGSVLGCVASWNYLHNETVNIYSHILGACVFLSLPLYMFHTEIPPRYAVATSSDIIVCSVYFLGVATCFILSTAFHTFMSHSEAFYLLGIQIDFQGVLILMWSSTVPLAHYSFPCSPALQWSYGAATAVLALLCSVATLHPTMGAVHLGHHRAQLFAAFGVSSFVAPIAHGLWLHGPGQTARVGLGWVLVTAVCNGLGMAAYSCKFPERLYPRRFDLLGASHQIMHVMVLLAALAYAKAVLEAFDFRHGHGEICI